MAGCHGGAGNAKTAKPRNQGRRAALRSTAGIVSAKDLLKTWSWDVETGSLPWLTGLLPRQLIAIVRMAAGHLLKLAHDHCKATKRSACDARMREWGEHIFKYFQGLCGQLTRPMAKQVHLSWSLTRNRTTKRQRQLRHGSRHLCHSRVLSCTATPDNR